MNLPPETARQLLVALIAYQKGVLDQVQFVDACAEWADQKQGSMLELLLRKDWIDSLKSRQVEDELKRQLAECDDDPCACLNRLMDDQVRESLSHLSLPPFVEAKAVAIPPRPPKAIPPSLMETEHPPSLTRDRYTLVGELGSGGIGQVWRAFDPRLGREVALKELKPECARHESHRARFLAEAKITAQLIHPNIVPAFEMVDEKDRPFYTMQLVQGRTLTDAIKEYHQKRRRKEAGPLEQRRLLNAFLAVCRAVDYAHDRGVLHRDLKGPNIILGDHDEVFLLDWGMAKVVKSSDARAELPPVQLSSGDSDAETVLGQQLGTPLYMAPEQAAGRVDQIDRRTDVYALGVILFEILTGAFPFTVSHEPPPDEDLPEKPEERMVEWNKRKKKRLYQRIQNDAPPRPRSIDPRVPSALEEVCLKCLNKKREDRYQTAAALASEVERWLADEPVTVYQDSLIVRVLRQARRRRALVASLAMLILAAVPLLSSLLLVMERGREDLLEEKKRTEKALELAIKREKEAADAASANKELANEKQVLLEDSQEQIKEMRESLKNLVAILDEELGDQPGTSMVRKQLLEDATGRLERAYRRKEVAAETDPTSLEARNSLGRVFLSAGLPQQAKEAFEKVEDATRKWLDRSRWSLKARKLRATCLAGIGEAYIELGQRLQAQPLFQQALQLYEDLARDELDDPNTKVDFVRTCHLIGQFEMEQERLDTALSLFKKAQKELGKLLDAQFEKPAKKKEVECLIATTQRLLALVYLQQKDHGKARTALNEGFRRLAPFMALERRGIKVQREHNACLDASGVLHLQRLEFKDAEKAFGKSLENRLNLQSIDRADPVLNRDVAQSWYWIGIGREAQGKLAEAENAFRSQLEIFEAMSNSGTLSTTDPLIGSYFHIGRIQVLVGKIQDARKNLNSSRNLILREEKALALDSLRLRRKNECLVSLALLERASLQSEKGKIHLAQIAIPPAPPGKADMVIDPVEQAKADYLEHCARVEKAMQDLEWAARQKDAPELLLHRAAAKARAGYHFDAMESVERLATLGKKNPEANFKAALAFGFCLECTTLPQALLPGVRKHCQKFYSGRALTLLRQLDELLYFDKPHTADELTYHFAFRTLRDDPDFLKLRGSGAVRPPG